MRFPVSLSISIHAPTKGATYGFFSWHYITSISIHAPTKGATPAEALLPAPLLHFNPRSHEGSDNLRLLKLPIIVHFNPRSHEGSDSPSSAAIARFSFISIHAPTKGATSHDRRRNQKYNYFNPRSHEGSDLRMATATGKDLDFNPRSHEGSDYDSNNKTMEVTAISIHAPTKGATVLPAPRVRRKKISIHAPTKGAT